MPTREERKEASRLERRVEDRRVAGTAEQDPRPRPPSRRAGPKPFGLEFRVKPELDWPWARDREWHAWYTWYETAEARDTALAALSRKERFWEFRPCDRR